MPLILFLLAVRLLAAQTTPAQHCTAINSFPHDKDSFTQGLAIQDGVLYEGTGLIGASTVQKIDMRSGKVIQGVNLGGSFSGEGLTVWKNRIIQLTGNKLGVVFDKDNLKQLKTFTYSTDARGITHDGKRLIVADGAGFLHFWDPETYKETGKLEVKENGKPLTNLNEIEYVRGEIYANVGQSYRIARISPATGRVTGWIDVKGILNEKERAEADVMNGIAYDSRQDRIFITGRYWPKLFEIKPK